MKSIVKSQLAGKWYLIAQTHNDKMMSFLEVFIYLSINHGKQVIDLLFVGIKSDRSKIMRKLSLRTLIHDDETFLVIQNVLYRKRLRLLMLDEKNGLMIVLDDKNKCLSIYSRRCSVKHEVIESCLSRIDFSKLNVDEIKLFSNSIC